MNVYLAGKYSDKEEIKRIAENISELGVHITSSWLTETYSPTILMGSVPSKDLREFALTDLKDIDRCDILILFSENDLALTKRNGRIVEFGYALGRGKIVWVVGPKENVFHYLPDLKHFLSIQDVYQEITRLINKGGIV